MIGVDNLINFIDKSRKYKKATIDNSIYLQLSFKQTVNRKSYDFDIAFSLPYLIQQAALSGKQRKITGFKHYGKPSRHLHVTQARRWGGHARSQHTRQEAWSSGRGFKSWITLTFLIGQRMRGYC
ncbi:hypothetical protein CDAR_285011 [Caerostris darwini]|uniref:Uncharacterized protein n=1 Tax=Caerostris darwini TaxID=1538125 RepID=A0AAV4NEH6_9ARAC|nr:hypothetical protein CDAR_285011 [Caerostris darwini]